MSDVLRFGKPQSGAESNVTVTRNHIREYFDERTVERGRGYFEAKHIRDSSLSPRQNELYLFGEVKGSARRVYDVQVELRFRKNGRNPIHRTDCTCPVMSDCKHAAALLFDYIAYVDKEEKFKDLDRRITVWLDDLTAASEELSAPASRSGEAPKEVLYIVDYRMDRNLPRLSIKPYTANRKKSGEYSALQSHYFSDLSRSRAQFIKPADAKLLHMYAMSTAFSSISELLPEDPALLELLVSLTVATGRCYWQGPNNPPLKQGSERPGLISWKLTNEHRHITELKVDGEHCLPLFAPFPLYVDTQRWELGSLKLETPWKVADAFLAGPAINPEDLDRVSELLVPLVGKAKIPIPSSKFQVTRLTGTPRPLITLHTLHEMGGKKLDDPQNVAVLRFDYDGMEVKGKDSSHEIRMRDEDKITSLTRDIAAEQRIISDVVQTGLIEYKSNLLPFDSNELVFKAGVMNSDLNWFRWLDLESSKTRLEWDGIVVFDPGWGLGRKQPQTTALRIDGRAGWWFNLALDIEVDGKTIPLLPILRECFDQFNGPISAETIERMSVNGQFYIRLPGGSYLGLPVDQVKDIYGTLLELFLDPGISDKDLELIEVSAGKVLALKYAASLSDATVTCDQESEGFLNKLRAFSSLEDFSVPREFTAQLRPYQMHGCAWLQFLSEYKLGGILADDMGLGKTVQMLAHLLAEKESGRAQGPCLVICPTSVGPNWVSEAARHAPTLTASLLRSGAETLAVGTLQNQDIIITSYTLMQRHIKELKKIAWHAVILDEAQFIKNYNGKTAKAADALKAHHKVCLTGTPIENHLGELFSQFNFAAPGFLGNSYDFRTNYQIPIERDNDRHVLNRLIQMVKPFVLRRTKDQVAADLPPKTVIVKPIELEGGQRELYEVVRLAAFQKVRDEIEARGLKRSQIVFLSELMKLRQVCCDPRLPKIDSPLRDSPSAKLITLVEMIKDLHEQGRKILVFSQFTSMLDLISAELKELGIEFVTLRGDTQDRTTPVARFQKGEVSVFLISLRAGGTGLNLTAADTVIHYDLWWNPAVEAQATDRAHRIGQDKPVFVYKLVGRGTIEQRILELQAKKHGLAQAILNDDIKMLAQFNEADINALFDPIDVEFSMSSD